MTPIGEVVKRYRIEHGLRQVDLAALMTEQAVDSPRPFDHGTVSRLERRKTVYPADAQAYYTIAAFARVVGKEPTDFPEIQLLFVIEAVKRHPQLAERLYKTTQRYGPSKDWKPPVHWKRKA
ncbi:MAG: hypothetical protein M1274_03915 [Actinobacteria bacterium]|nr:hypothetical protein [Actinomycetota bacterium]